MIRTYEKIGFGDSSVTIAFWNLEEKTAVFKKLYFALGKFVCLFPSVVAQHLYIPDWFVPSFKKREIFFCSVEFVLVWMSFWLGMEEIFLVQFSFVLVWMSLVWCQWTWFGMSEFGLVQLSFLIGMDDFFVWVFGWFFVWYGWVWFGVNDLGLVWVNFGLVQLSPDWHGWFFLVWMGLFWCSLVWVNLVWYDEFGLVQLSSVWSTIVQTF